MDCLTEMLQKAAWEDFYKEKTERNKLLSGDEERLKNFVETEAYLPYVKKMLEGQPFSAPQKSLIGKKGTDKKRVVYIYSEEENWVLKMLAWQLRRFDSLFSEKLYSFRCEDCVRDAIEELSENCKRKEFYTFKADISNYFNSIPVNPLISMLYERIPDEPLCRFFEAHLRSSWVEYNGQRVEEEKGVMAGTPISPFLANVYLMDLDEAFEGEIYARYSDDIILFAESEEIRDIHAERLLTFIRDKGLAINPEKVSKTAPDEPWTFLGITYRDGNTDISEISMKKMKDKLRRKSRSLVRWKRAKKVTDEQAVKAFIRAVNRRLYDNPKHSELTWARWYFPLISTEQSLRELDHYIQSCIRYVMFENHGKKTYEFRYERMKEMGYRSLVHEYYGGAKEK